MLEVKATFIPIFFILFSTTSSAQEKAFEREYIYKASELDSKISCRAITINQLRLTLLNEIGVYVESESLLKTTEVSGQFSQDFVENIATISAGITKFKVIDEKWDGETFSMKASITIDEKEIGESLKQVVSDRRKMQEMEHLKLQLKAATEELDNLKKVDSAKHKGKEINKDRDKLYNDGINTLNAGNNFLNGIEKSELKDYEGAIADYTKAIEIQPNNEDAYHNRGIAKGYRKDYNGAIIDFTNVIRIDPNYELAYYNRGNAKDDLKDFNGAISDYNKAIKLNPNNSNTYNNRGIAKGHLKDYNGAITDYNRAIDITPEDAAIYFNRGLAKLNLGQRDSGCKDLSKAGELGNEKAYKTMTKSCN